jgi:hypothetical protein
LNNRFLVIPFAPPKPSLKLIKARGPEERERGGIPHDPRKGGTREGRKREESGRGGRRRQREGRKRGKRGRERERVP